MYYWRLLCAVVVVLLVLVLILVVGKDKDSTRVHMVNLVNQVFVHKDKKHKSDLVAKGGSHELVVGKCIGSVEEWKVGEYLDKPGTIFVSVASYRDDECTDTVSALFDMADNPEDIFVGVVQQNSKDATEDCFDRCPSCAKRKRSGNIRVTNFSHLEAKGPTFARYHASKLWRGEEFYLQIDSHIKFEQGWDTTMIEQIRDTNDPDAVLGHYPPSEKQIHDMRETGFKEFVTMTTTSTPGVDGLPEIKGEVKQVGNRSTPDPVYVMGANLICFPGRVLYDMSFDPYLSYLFFGEELLFSARLWTHGYNMYAPLKAFASHHYGRDDKPKYSTDHKEAEQCRKQAVQRVKYMFGLAEAQHVHPDYLIEVEKYGMGKKRKLSDYLSLIGKKGKKPGVRKNTEKPKSGVE